MRHRNLLGTLLFCLGILAFAQPAVADTVDGITFTLVNANLTGNPGDTLTWDYNVSNARGVQILGLFVSGNIFSGGTANSLAFDGFGPSGTIDNGFSLQGVLFRFFSDPLTSNSTNSGKFDLTVLDANGKQIDLFAHYTATISPAGNVPEPGTLALLASGLLAGLLVIRRAAH
jgi:PEP-CTERM motif-containing protein